MLHKQSISLEAAQDTGIRILGSEAYRSAYDLRLENKQIPPIYSSQDDLQLAKENDQTLVLQAGNLSMIDMANKFVSIRTSALLHHTRLYLDENFAKKPPPLVWILMSGVLPGSTGKDMPNQMALVAKELERQCVHEKHPHLADTIFAFRGARERIENLMRGDDWQKASELIQNSTLATTVLPHPCELFNFMALGYTENKKHHFSNVWLRTPVLSSDSFLMQIADFSVYPRYILSRHPSYTDDLVGISLSLPS